jgi:hypothetical protein
VPIIVGTHHEISSVGRGVSVAAVWLLLSTDRIAARTLGLSNANRHVGLALLLAGKVTRAKHALPSVACYAVVLALLMVAYPKLFLQLKAQAAAGSSD